MAKSKAERAADRLIADTERAIAIGKNAIDHAIHNDVCGCTQCVAEREEIKTLDPRAVDLAYKALR